MAEPKVVISPDLPISPQSESDILWDPVEPFLLKVAGYLSPPTTDETPEGDDEDEVIPIVFSHFFPF